MNALGTRSEPVTRRSERIGEQVRAELARLLRTEVSDPRIGLVTLTRVDVAPDLSNARVLWSALDAKDEVNVDAVQKGLESAAGFLRHQLAASLSLRRTPELRFRNDSSQALGDRTLKALHDLGPILPEEDGDGTA